ncbi:MAG: ATP-dependent zinc metalloprotease FtsH [Proteobacteria bacterium]|nr:ATP-dependent zinc metalloprotease FtsH [Pseudomonadota bacterium]MBU1685798.1 ATP-dependent zinc metalloprotease FtsH [Pseudomonadota bacterium]
MLPFIVITIFQQFFMAQNVETIPYSQFKQYIAEGKVGALTISPESISGTLPEKPGQGFTTVRVYDPDLVKDLDAHAISYTGRTDSKFLGFILAWVIPLALFFLIWRFFMKKMGSGMGVMSFSKNKAKIFAESETKVSFADVAGIDEAKEELQEVVEFLSNPGKFQKLGGRIPKGVLLVGPPGTGKTLLARAVAGEAKVPFFSISGSEFVEMFVGVGAARVRDLFSQAAKQAPCIIFIDELDALGKARGMNVMGGHDEREQTLNQLLVEMDGFATNKGVIIMSATNRPEILDPALLRPGRFDRQVLVDRPDINGREAILKIHSQNVLLDPEVDLRKVAGRTPGFVGADLANLVNEAALLAARKNKETVEAAEFDEAIDRVVGGLEKKNRMMNGQEKEIVTFHESGHAIVAESVEHADPVHKISIIPRGIAALGYTQQQPTEDRYLMTRAELLDRLAVLLGGRVAEELVFNEISTGAQNDLQRATDIARSMVTQYGMSDALGLVTYERPRQPMFAPEGFTSGKSYSEQKAAQIDDEVTRLVEEAHQRVIKILTDRRALLDSLAKLLAEKESVTGEELREMMVAS